jgi:hypothetical protein
LILDERDQAMKFGDRLRRTAMRRAVICLTCAICGLSLLCVMAPALAWLSQKDPLILPDAVDIRVERLSLARQRLTYHLPAGRTQNDLFEQLEQDGWTRDVVAEKALRRDRMEDLGGTFAVFRRPGWLGLAPEVATILISSSEAWLTEITLVRCFAVASRRICL